MVSALDDGVGRLLGALRAHGIDETTLVVFLSDNGGPPNNGSSNRPLRGNKGGLYEGGIRVPFALRWTGHLPAGAVYDKAVSSLDLFATTAALAGAEPPAGGRGSHALDGDNLVPYLRGEQSDPPHRTLFWRTDGGASFAVRQGDQKLDEPAPGTLELYDLSADVGESHDIASSRPEGVREIDRLKRQWDAQLVPPGFDGLSKAKSKAAARER